MTEQEDLSFELPLVLDDPLNKHLSPQWDQHQQQPVPQISDYSQAVAYQQSDILISSSHSQTNNAVAGPSQDPNATIQSNGILVDVGSSVSTTQQPIESATNEGSRGKCEKCGTRAGGKDKEKRRTTKKNKASINAERIGGTSENICVKCAEENIITYNQFTCLGCNRPFDTFDEVRKRSKHGGCPLARSEPQEPNSGAPSGSTTKKNKRSSSSASTQSKKQKYCSYSNFVCECDEFEMDHTIVPFDSVNQSCDIVFRKDVVVHLAPDKIEPPYVINLMQFYPVSQAKLTPACETIFKQRKNQLKMNIDLPPWPKQEDVARVNVEVHFLDTKRVIKSKESVQNKGTHDLYSDLIFVDAGSSICGYNSTASSSVPNQQSLFSDNAVFDEPTSKQPSNQQAPSTTNSRSDGVGGKQLLNGPELTSYPVDPRGFTLIEFSTANFDYDELEASLQSEEFDLNARDNLGYTKEFWCSYFNNMRALEMIQDAKIRNMNLSRLIDLDSVVLNILSFIDCGLILNFVLHEERIFSYFTMKRFIPSSLVSQESVSKPYEDMFGRFKSGKIHMLYSDQRIFGQSTIANAAELNVIAKKHKFIDFGLEQCLINLICSEASSKIISLLNTDSTKNEMVSNMRMIGCEYRSERCKSHKDLSYSVKYDLCTNSTLNLDDVGSSVHSFHLVDSKDNKKKYFGGNAPENLTHVILGPHFRFSNGGQFFNHCNIRHLELYCGSQHELESEFWELIGTTSPNLRKISLHLTSQNERRDNHLIASILGCCAGLEHLSIVTYQGSFVLQKLVELNVTSGSLTSIDLRYLLCDEETLKQFMIWYGNVCNVRISKMNIKLDKQFLIDVIKSDGAALKHVPSELRSDKEIVIGAVENNGLALEYASSELRKDKQVVMEAVMRNGVSLKYALNDLQNDKEVVMKAVKRDGLALEYASDDLKSDIEVIMSSVEQNACALMYVPDTLMGYTEVVKNLLKKHGDSTLKYVSDEWKNNNKEVFMEVLKKNGAALKYASEKLKKDKECVLEAAKNNIDSLYFASDKLKNNKAFITRVLQSNVRALLYASDDLKNDKELVMEAAKKDIYILKYASDRLKNSKEFFMEYVKKNGGLLEYASNELKDDIEFVMAAVHDCSLSLKYASSRLKNNNEVVMEAVKTSGEALEFASIELKNNKEVVMEAVKTSREALMFASLKLRGDKEVVLEAVKASGGAFEFASASLRNDKPFIKEAVKHHVSALEYASSAIKNDKQFLIEIAKSDVHTLLYAPSALKNDKQFLFEAFKNDVRALRFASYEIQKSKSFFMEAVKVNGAALQYASSELKNDKDVVIEAVKNNGAALQYASSELKNDKDVIEAAKNHDLH